MPPKPGGAAPAEKGDDKGKAQAPKDTKDKAGPGGEKGAKVAKPGKNPDAEDGGDKPDAAVGGDEPQAKEQPAKGDQAKGKPQPSGSPIANFKAWLFAEECTWRQILVLAIIVFLLINILYYCIKVVGKRIRKMKATKHTCRKLKKMYKKCCMNFKTWTCPITISFRRKEDTYHHIVFLPGETKICPVGKPADVNLCNNSAFKLLSTCIGEAEKSIDLCLFVITCRELTDLLIEAVFRGVTVRLVTDGEISTKVTSEVERLKHAGAQVFLKSSPFLMHHKFAIVDERILIIGSFNWTKQGLCGNHEHLMITNEKRIVQPFYKEFKKLRHSISMSYNTVVCTDKALPHEHNFDHSFSTTGKF